MTDEARIRLEDPEAIRALTHPVRMRLLVHLMSEGPATASQAARAVADTPSNCSYHLRTLARFGWVAADGAASADGRERPWRALVTGFSVEPGTDPDSEQGRSAAALMALQAQQDAQLIQEAVTRYPAMDKEWQDASSFHAYNLRVTPEELIELTKQIDALLRPYIAATREERPDGSRPTHVGFQAFPKGDEDGRTAAQP